ncbi:MAG: hypothetical protein AB9882_11000 [Ignavibacteriaceae bacterium]
MLTIIDKSNYLKGLLILARKDDRLVENEKKIIREAAKRLGFSKDFYEETLRNLMNNKYLVDSPIKFSSAEVAKLFISEGIELAATDNDLCSKEVDWLKSVAFENDISHTWFEETLDSIMSSRAS